MAILCPLFSGSSGNATYIGYNGSGILIDAGVSARRLDRALADNEIDSGRILGLFVTHEHRDHVCGLSVFTRKHGTPVFCSDGTRAALERGGILSDAVAFSQQVEIGGFTVARFATSHDCPDSSGYVITTPDGKRIAVCTDLGYVSAEVEAALTGCHGVVLESNHDLAMLRNGPYPPQLTRRILSDHGHLSNPSSADFAARLAQSGTTRFVLAHISKENNTPAQALTCTRTRLALCGFEEGRDYTLTAAAPEGNGRMVI